MTFVLVYNNNYCKEKKNFTLFCFLLSLDPNERGPGGTSSHAPESRAPAQGSGAALSCLSRIEQRARSSGRGNSGYALGKVGVERIGVDVDDICFVVVDPFERPSEPFDRGVLVAI